MKEQTTMKEHGFFVNLIAALLITSSPLTIIMFVLKAMDGGFEAAFSAFADFVSTILE